MKKISAFVLILLMSIFAARSQHVVQPLEIIDTTKTYQVELKDGSEFIGTILSFDSTNLEMKTSSISNIQINRSSIRKMKTIETKMLFKGAVGIPNPNTTRYFFAPSAFNLKKGEGYYQNTYLILNSINYGITDHFSIGASLELISTFSNFGQDWSPIYLITPKIGYQVAKNVNVGAGVLIANMGFTGGLQLVYGLLTYGNPENNVTLALSTGFADGEYLKDAPFTLNGMFRLGRKTTFITENWIVPGSGALYSYGVRFFGTKIAVDLGFLNNKDIVDFLFIGVPYVDFVVKF
ncbi:MAG TPA: hypothetical protein VFP20_07260 [Bacteroidales bacterium]|nr:hypothetical protein [Bacteroidales bacterium]